MSTVNPTSTATPPAPAASPNRFSEMSSEDFIKIMFTELSHQDPLQPNDSAALLQQMQSIRSIESDIDLSKKLQSMVQQNQMAGAGTMLGKFVRGLTADNDQVSGLVVALARENDVVSLELDNGYRVPVSSIQEVIDPGMFHPSTPGATTPGSTTTV